MDSDWFTQRMAACGLDQDRIGQAIGRDRSTVSRILSGDRELKLSEVERFAKLFGETPLEIIRHAYSWSSPLGGVPEAEIDDELLRLAIEVAKRGLRRNADREQLFAGTVAGVYRTLASRRRAGRPIDGTTLEILEESIAGGLHGSPSA
jgi:transcriptional regulator with XRE-family HTH domain